MEVVAEGEQLSVDVKSPSNSSMDPSATSALVPAPVPLESFASHIKSMSTYREAPRRAPVGSPGPRSPWAGSPSSLNSSQAGGFGAYGQPVMHTGFEREYEALVRAADSAAVATGGFVTGTKPSNLARNRYGNILPLEATRVKLTPTRFNADGYINANHVDGGAYILGQAPPPDAFGDWWQMVYEKGVRVIVCLTRLQEGDRLKADKYWPDVGQPIRFGRLVVALDDVDGTEAWVRRTMSLTYTRRGSDGKPLATTATVVQYHYLDWPDYGVPTNAASILALINAANESRREQRPSFGPILVHCSAGIGRSGAYALVDIVLREVRRAVGGATEEKNPNDDDADDDEDGDDDTLGDELVNERDTAVDGGEAGDKTAIGCSSEGEEGSAPAINVASTLFDLRTQRFGMVQTPEQYAFAHNAILEGLVAEDLLPEPAGAEAAAAPVTPEITPVANDATVVMVASPAAIMMDSGAAFGPVLSPPSSAVAVASPPLSPYPGGTVTLVGSPPPPPPVVFHPPAPPPPPRGAPM